MKHLVLIPFLISLYSLLVYAFTGNPIWTPLEGDGVRAMILYFVHMVGLASIFVYTA